MSLSSTSPQGKRFYVIAADEVPTLVPVEHPAPGTIRDELYESPIFFSTSRTLARQWQVNEAGIFLLIERPVPSATREYVNFTTPAGVAWVVGLADDGTLYVTRWDSGVPKSRRSLSPLMHKGKLLYVSDHRFPPPWRG